MRFFAVATLALLLGLLAARLPSIGESEPSFSWLGFVGGAAIVSLATGIGRILAAAAADASPRAIRPLERWTLRASLSALLVALVSFVLLLYTPWQWPRYLVTVVIPIGVLAVFIGVGAAWFGAKHGT